MIRTLIVDDEPLARRGIRLRLEREKDVEVVAEAADGPAAVEAIRSLRPDLVFLDVQMPGLDGFQVLDQISHDHLPMVVFITAYDAHALRAFEAHALDYLLKPYSELRFRESLSRARRELLRSGDPKERRRMLKLLDARDARRNGANGEAPFSERFMVRDRDRIVLVRVDDLVAIEAAGNYVLLVDAKRKHLLRTPLQEIEKRLDPARFVRIHRSTIVNAERIREILPESHGDGAVVLEGGATYRMSRGHRSRLFESGPLEGDGSSR